MLQHWFPGMPTDAWGMLTHVLWRADPTHPLTPYPLLNLLEALAWFAVAAWVWRRHARDPGGAWNHAYASLFIVFGITDLIEARTVTLLLIAAKGVVFAGILLARREVLRRYYPDVQM